MAKSVYQVSWISEYGKRLGVWRTAGLPEYDSSYPMWCRFTRLDTQQLVTLNNGLVVVEEVAGDATSPVEKYGLQLSPLE